MTSSPSIIPVTATNFVILVNGNLVITKRLIDTIHGCRIIAANGGIRHAATLGAVPELWVGDFDSVDTKLLKEWESIKRISYLSEKKQTDGEIAVYQALERGARRIVLAGALSGQRFDHALQHLMLAMSLTDDDINVTLTSGLEEAFVLTSGKHEFDLPHGSLFSVIAFSNIKGLKISGAHYLLNDFPLSFGSSRTLSNIVEKKITIAIEQGSAFLLCRPYDCPNV